MYYSHSKKGLQIFLWIVFSSILLACKDDDISPANAKVEAKFAISTNTSIEVGDAIIFTNQSTNNLKNFEWFFEGGIPFSSSSQTPLVTYNTAGKYDVSLIVSNDQSSDTVLMSELITVTQKLEAKFDLSDSVINQSNEVTFTDNSIGSVTNWAWTFDGGDPSTSSDPNPVITYNTSGVYNVTLVVSNGLDSDEIKLEKRISVIPTSGLIAHFPFNANANDESDNSLHGEVFGASLTTDRYGNSNQAFNFDGIDDRIEVDNNSLLENQTYSLSVWFKAQNNTGALISMSGFNPVQNNCGYYLSVVDGNLSGLSNISTNNWARNVDDEVISLNQWHHVVFTYDGTTLELFMDGVSISTLELIHQVNYSEHNPLQIGTYSTQSGGTIYTGELDDIRIFDRALNENEIEALVRE